MMHGRPVTALTRATKVCVQAQTWAGVRPSVTSRSRTSWSRPEKVPPLAFLTTLVNLLAWVVASVPGCPKWYAPGMMPFFFIPAMFWLMYASVKVVPSVALAKAKVIPAPRTAAQLMLPWCFDPPPPLRYPAATSGTAPNPPVRPTSKPNIGKSFRLHCTMFCLAPFTRGDWKNGITHAGRCLIPRSRYFRVWTDSPWADNDCNLDLCVSLWSRMVPSNRFSDFFREHSKAGVPGQV